MNGSVVSTPLNINFSGSAPEKQQSACNYEVSCAITVAKLSSNMAQDNRFYYFCQLNLEWAVEVTHVICQSMQSDSTLLQAKSEKFTYWFMERTFVSTFQLAKMLWVHGDGGMNLYILQ
jgi:hypothetical protein